MTTERVPKSNALPEGFDYQDDGCEVAPKCLACPLPKCRYDVHGGARVIRNVFRDAEIERLRDADWSPDDIAAHLSVSRRTVYRVLAVRRAS